MESGACLALPCSEKHWILFERPLGFVRLRAIRGGLWSVDRRLCHANGPRLYSGVLALQSESGNEIFPLVAFDVSSVEKVATVAGAVDRLVQGSQGVRLNRFPIGSGFRQAGVGRQMQDRECQQRHPSLRPLAHQIRAHRPSYRSSP